MEFAENFGVKSGHFGSADQTPFTTNLYSCVSLGRKRAEVFLQEAVPENDPVPRAVIVMQTFKDLIGHNPHCDISVTDGCFYDNKGMFLVASPLELKKLEAIFRHKVFRMLVARRKISREMIFLLSTWRHSGFHVF